MIIKNVLITGASGFIGSSLAKLLGGLLPAEYRLYTPSSSELDLTDIKSVKKYRRFICPEGIEIIIHCAGVSPQNWNKQPENTLRDNLMMYYNLGWLESRRGVINFSSGAVFDKSQHIERKVDSLDQSLPRDDYGFSKLLIESRLSEYNAMHLRLFGLFGPNEENTRFIKSSILKYNNREQIEINQDCKHTFFSIYDLAIIIASMIKNNDGYTMNIGYEGYTTLTAVAGVVNTLNTYKVPIKIQETGWAKSYWCQSSGLKEYCEQHDIELLGLTNSIRRMFSELKNEN